MKRLTKVLTLLMIVGLLFALVGCAAETTTPSEKTEPEKMEKQETEKEKEPEKAETPTEPLQMYWFSDGVEGDVMQTILDAYEAETGVKIELVVLPYGDYETKLTTVLRGGEAPALARVTEGTAAVVAEHLLTLGDAYDTSKYTNVYLNSAGEAVSLPLDLTANGPFINKDLCDKYDVNYPALGESWTWAEFETEFAKLMGKEGVAFPGVFDNKAHRFMPMVYQFGGKLWGDSYKDCKVNTEPVVEALTTLQRMNQNGTLDPAVWAGSGNPSELFRTGQYGFHMSGNWFVAGYQELGFNWCVAPMPVGNGDGATRSTILGGKGMVAFDGSGQEDAAKAFIDYLSKPEVHDQYTSGVPFLSPRLDAEVDFGDFQAAYDVFQNEISNTPVENVKDWQKQIAITGMYPIINKAVETACGGQDVTEVLTKLAQDLMDKAAELGLE